MMKITQICVLIFLFCVGYTSKAQVASYTFTHQIGIFTPNSTSATNVAAVEADSGISTALPIGFDFMYGTSTYTEFFMSSNGFISFGPVGNTITANNLSTANTSQRPIIAPLWDDLDGRATVNSNNVSKASYEVSGVAPNRVLTVEWLNWEWNWNSTEPVISFQVKLYETTNVIEFVYRQESAAINGTGSASIGINDATGSGDGSFLNLDTDLSIPTVTSTTSVTDIDVKPANNQVFTFTPPACLYKGVITVTNLNVPTASLNLSIPASVSMDFYITNGAIPTASTTPSGTIAVGATSLPLTGLSASSIYTVYVKYACAALGSEWHKVFQFSTPCGVVSNFFEGFENAEIGSSTNNTYPYCWSYVDTVTTSGYGYVNSSSANNGNNGFYTYRASTTSANYNGDVLLISPETNNLGNGTKQIRFWAKVSSSSYINTHKFELYTMDGTTSTATKTLLQGNIPLTDSWQEFIFPLPVTTDDYLAFSFERDGGAAYVYLDDIYYEDIETCFHPVDVTFTNITQVGADISWTPSPQSTGGTGYEYEIRTSGAPGSGTTGLEASGNTTNLSVTISALDPNTDYEVFVRSVCGTATSRWSQAVMFKTLCATFGNFSENFDNISTGSPSKTGANYPDCWSYIDSTTTGYGYVVASNPQSSPRVYRLYRANTASGASSEELVLVSPPTDNLGNGAKQLRFSIRSYSTTNYNSKLEILSMPDPTTTTGATVLATINNNNDRVWAEYVVPLPVGTDDFFAFRLAYPGVTTASSITIDDVYYEDVPTPSIVNVTKNDVLCYDANTGDISVEVEGGALPLTYTWSPAVSTTDTATGLAGGTYTVTVTDALNRTVSETITIDEPDELLSNYVVTGISCNGADDATITIAPTGGVAPYTILWSTNDTGNTISNLVPGNYTVTITDANFCSITEDVTIIEPAILTATGTQTDVSLYNGTDGEAVVAMTGGTAPYTYTWTPAVSSTDTASNLAAGTYTVVVTDANGCTTTHMFTITEPIPLMVDTYSQTNVSCNGGSNGTATVDVIGGNAPYTYQWSPSGGTAATATGLATGTYEVEITDSTANTITHTFVITEPDPIIAILSHKTDVLCSSTATGSATITVNGGVGPFTYVWSHGVTTPNATLNNLNAGNYVVTVKDVNGCSATTQVTVAIAQPSPIVITNTDTTNVSCFGMNDGALTVAVTGGVAPYTYNWSNGQSGATIGNLTHGTYTVTVTDANNCTQSQSFSVTQPAFVNPPSVSNQGFCSGQNATLKDVLINGTNIKWYNAISGGTALPATTALTNGTTYYASQTIGTCESTRVAVQVTLHTGTPLVTTQLSVCGNTRIQNMTIDGFNYTQLKWYDTATSTTPLVASQLLTSKTYYVSSVTGTCESTRQPIQVTVSATVTAPTATFQTVCGGTTLAELAVTKDPAGTLNWYSSLQAMIPLAHTTVVTSGTYYVQQVIGNCESSKVAVQVQVTNVAVPTISVINTCEGLTIADYNVENGTNYVWFIDNNSTTTALPTTQLITSGTYYIANELSGCMSARRNVAVNVSSVPLSPTGATFQTFLFAATIGDLRMNEPNVSWFATYTDAIDQVNELPDTTPLIDKAKYYGIIVGGNNCASTPTEVEVEVKTVGLLELDLAQLRYFPNPVDTELNINYIEDIKKVEVFTITGQKVFTNEFTSNEIRVDLSSLSSGTYMVRIETETASQFVKIVKR